MAAGTQSAIAVTSSNRKGPRPFPAAFNASEAALAEPVADRPRLQLMPREAEKF